MKVKGSRGKRALGFLLKSELCQKRSKFCMQFCHVLRTFLELVTEKKEIVWLFSILLTQSPTDNGQQLVVLILFQIGMIYGVLNFWDQRTCRCMETVCCTEGLICFKFVSLFFLTN